jgi:hypothetical protein
MDSVATYSEARNEYMKQLSTWIVPFMINHYRNLWTSSAKAGPQKAMLIFQEKCAEVPKWNQDTISEHINNLLDNCRCDYLEELMAAVFIAHTKVLISIRVSSKHKKLQITLPKLDHFLHRIFTECARAFWKIPYLFLDEQKPIEMQKNMLQAEAMCTEAMTAAVRSLLPIKNILAEYLSDDVTTSDPIIEETESAPASPRKIPVEQAPIPPSISTSDTVALPEAATALPEAATALPVAATALPEAATALPVAATALPEAATALPKAATALPEADVEPNGEDSEIFEDYDTMKIADKESSLDDTISLDNNESDTTKHIGGNNKTLSGSDRKSPKNIPPVAEPEELTIDTEPASVNFSNYDQVFDENSDQAGTFKYVPKDLEPGEIPRLVINEEQAIPLSLDSSVTSLETPGISEAEEILADSILD